MRSLTSWWWWWSLSEKFQLVVRLCPDICPHPLHPGRDLVELLKVVPSVPVDPDIADNHQVYQENQVEDPPDFENHIDPKLLIEDLNDDVEDLVEAAEEDEEAGEDCVGLDIQQVTPVYLDWKSIWDFESRSGACQVGTGQQNI